jgi:organic radical activating enzyme
VSDTLFVSEIFDSVQGEGPSQGYPCTFLRLAGCNLACTWCDTEYSWNWAKYDVRKEAYTEVIGTLAARFGASRRLVITGGEPLLQQRALEQLLSQLPSTLPIEIETNGTLEPTSYLAHRVDQWNVSPKLSHSGETHERRLNPAALQKFRDTGRAWLKLVTQSIDDSDELSTIVNLVTWPSERVYLMPEARSPAQLTNLTPQIVNLAIATGYKFTNRLHLQVWGGKRGC